MSESLSRELKFRMEQQRRRVSDVANARTSAFDSLVTETIDDVSRRTEILDSVADIDGCARIPTSFSMSPKMRTNSEERICI